MDTTRRKFIGMLCATTALGCTTAFAETGDSWFRDFDPNSMYIWDFPYSRIYKGAKFRDALKKILQRYGEDFIKNVEKDKRDKWDIMPVGREKEEGTIHITGDWLREFWRRHKDDAV